MARPKTLIIGTLLVGVVSAWYMFRPERAFLNRRADDPAPTAVVATLRSGQFVSRAHTAHGRVDLLELAGGQLVVRLSEFETSDGPDLAVYLLGSADAEGAADLDRVGYLSLGPLKGNIGPQNYAIPPGADLARYHAVAVWCRRFGTNFTVANLGAPAPPS